MLGGFGEAVGFGEERGDGKVGSAVGSASLFEETDGFGFVFVLAGESDAEEVEGFGGEGICLDGLAGEGFGGDGAIGAEMDEGQVRENGVGGGMEVDALPGDWVGNGLFVIFNLRNVMGRDENIP